MTQWVLLETLMWVNIQRIIGVAHCANVVWPDLEPPLVGKGEDPGKFHERLALDEDDMPGIDAVGHLDGLRRGQWVSGR